jgi:hypothetical protein
MRGCPPAAWAGGRAYLGPTWQRKGGTCSMACVQGLCAAVHHFCSAAGQVRWMQLAAGLQGVGVEMRLDVRPIPRCRRRANQHGAVRGVHPVPVCVHAPSMITWCWVKGNPTCSGVCSPGMHCIERNAPGTTAAAGAPTHLVACKHAPGFRN